MHTGLGAFFVLANFLGVLNRQLRSTSFLAIVDARCICGELKRHETGCANLTENACCADSGTQMLCSESASMMKSGFCIPTEDILRVWLDK
ncbi:hypothetical protein AVEN_21546-1 [Araneus ventricosus]|uniref:Uncharacterized protein n=1 Tax=Araneus ventricosus TaxID=182803 RepID=A0A4Y2MDJ0_ARAVE|nr:hypothetical protein AVEN_21546-1 [Araneus ventricosus]